MLKLLPLLFSVAAGDIEEKIRQRKQMAALYAVVGLIGLSAWSALLVGTTRVLADTYGSAAAAFLMAGALIVLALVVWIVALFVRRRQRRTANPAFYTAAAAAAPIALRSGSFVGIAVAGLAAYVVGRIVTRPGRR